MTWSSARWAVDRHVAGGWNQHQIDMIKEEAGTMDKIKEEAGTMDKIKNIKKLTDNRFLNMYEMDARDSKGNPMKYYFASRGKEGELKCATKKNFAEGVMVYAVLEEEPDKIVLIRQYRYPIDDYIYEMPAGLVDPMEDVNQTAVREFREETGMDLKVVTSGSESCRRPFYTTIGLTDEAVSIVYGYAGGNATDAFSEDSEDIEIIIADKDMARDILKNGNVAMKCALLLMQFLQSDRENPFGFLEV